MYGTELHAEQKPGGRKNPAGFAGTKKYGGKRKDKDEDSVRAGWRSRGRTVHSQHSKTGKIK